MLKIIRGRRTGRTTELIKISENTQAYILVANIQRQKLVADMARNMGANIPYPVTLDDYMRNQFRGSFIKNILIDDADDILCAIFYTVHIDAITMSTNVGRIEEE